MRTGKFFSMLLLGVVAGLSLLTTACGDNPTTNLRVFHASPDAPKVDVLINGKTVLTKVPYETASNYLRVKAGSRKIEVRASGGTSDVINAAVTLTKKSFYTLLAVNKVAKISPLLLTDDLTPPASGKVKVRFVHVAPSAPAVDIYVVKPGTDIATVSPTVSNVAFKTVTSYLSVPAGSYEVFVTPAGTKTIAIDTGALTLTAGQIHTGIALDAPGGGTPLAEIVLKDLK